MHEAVAKIVLLYICTLEVLAKSAKSDEIHNQRSIWGKVRLSRMRKGRVRRVAKVQGNDLLFLASCIVDHWIRSRKFTLV